MPCYLAEVVYNDLKKWFPTMSHSASDRGRIFFDLLACTGAILVLSSFSQIFSPVKSGDSLWSQDSLDFELLLKFSAGVALVVTSLSVANAPSGASNDSKQSSELTKVVYLPSGDTSSVSEANRYKDIAS